MVASAPGRVNLIGEHTDYNEGFVLPMAIDRRIAVAASPRDDDLVVLHSDTFEEGVEFRVDGALRPGGDPAVWSGYVRGVAWALAAAGVRVRGMHALVTGDVPLAAGLSSSAALEMATARACCELAGAGWDPVSMARIAQRAENEFVGVNCGIMDQLASACGRAGRAMLLDCRSLEVRYHVVPTDVVIVVMDTGVRRSLAASAYNERRAACEAAVAVIRAMHPSVRALRDVTPTMLEDLADRMDAATLKRVTHVVMETARPADFAQALDARNFTRAGDLMIESHASLRDLFEVSSAHLDRVCDVAREHPACFGARMTGAGFGGSAIALVRAAEVEDFIAATQPRYEAATYRKSRFFIAHADEGARLG